MGTKLIPTFESFLELMKVSLSCRLLLVSFFFSRKARVKKSLVCELFLPPSSWSLSRGMVVMLL